MLSLTSRIVGAADNADFNLWTEMVQINAGRNYPDIFDAVVGQFICIALSVAYAVIHILRNTKKMEARDRVFLDMCEVTNLNGPAAPVPARVIEIILDLGVIIVLQAVAYLVG